MQETNVAVLEVKSSFGNLGPLDRISRVLTEEDLTKLVELHHSLNRAGYGLAFNIEHLACYLDKGSGAQSSVEIQGAKKRLFVRPELRLDTMLADSGVEVERNSEHPDYDHNSVGPDSEKQRIDSSQYIARKAFIQRKWNDSITREDILKFELELRQKDINDHRLYLYEETQREGTDLYGRQSFYGDDFNCILLTIATAHWLKEQGPFFYDRAKEHYTDIGIRFDWKKNMERAVVLETVNGAVKHYPILCDEFLINEAFPAQVPLCKELVEAGTTDLIPSASISYRQEEDHIRKDGLKSGTGVFVLPSTIKDKDLKQSVG